MSNLEDVAKSLRSVPEVAPKYLRISQETSRILRDAEGFASTSSHGCTAVQVIQSAQECLADFMDSIRVFTDGARDFADTLAQGQSLSVFTSHSLGIVSLGNHAGLSVQRGGSEKTIIRVDPLTGNEVRWRIDSSGRTVEASGTLRRISQEGRTNKEKRVTARIGNDSQNPNETDGGHLIGAGLLGSNGEINIVPQNANLNRGTWRSLEKKIQGYLNKGCEVEFSINVRYGDEESKEPDKFVYSYKVKDPKDPVKVVDSFSQRYKNQTQKGKP